VGMFSETLVISFADGTTVDVVTNQRDLADIDRVLARRGEAPPPGRLAMQAFPFEVLRMRGWLAYRRLMGDDLDWDTFQARVDEVVAKGADEAAADPTPMDTLEGS
jgi:hypothetical protein